MVSARLFFATLLLALFAVGSAPARASVFVHSVVLTVAGQPTPEETIEISFQWNRMLIGLPGARDCVAPLTVVVVDSAEAAWGGGVSGIAAFYRRSVQTVYIEHGKVRAEHLIHEFAHHVDFSCGIGVGPLGRTFLEAQGFDPDHEWTRGSGWRDLPAEHFAEAVVGWFGIDSVDLPVTPAGYAVVGEFAAHGIARTAVAVSRRDPSLTRC